MKRKIPILISLSSMLVILLAYGFRDPVGGCQYPGQLLPDEGDCSRYYQCDGNLNAMQLQCPYDFLWNADLNACDYPLNVDCGGAPLPRGKKTAALTSSSVELTFAGNQAVILTLKNHNVLGVGVSVHANYQNGNDWSTILLPFGEDTKNYSVFGTVPIGWKFDASTNADAVNVSVIATWEKW